MAVLVKLNDQIAYVENYKWYCDDPVTLFLLNSSLDPYGPSPSKGDYDSYAANLAVQELGAEIIGEPEDFGVDAGTIY